jgi:hypothetical protein
MIAWIQSLNGLETFFVICALAGGMGLLLRLVLMFLGGIGDMHGDLHADGALAGDLHVGDLHAGDLHAGDVHAGDAHAGEVHDTGHSFQLLTLQGLTGFFLMFGLVGLAMSRESRVGTPFSLLGGFGAGAVALYMVAKLFQWARMLQSSGTLNFAGAVGKQGTIYLTIPPGGTGKVEVAVQERLMVLDAVAEDKSEIKTGAAGVDLPEYLGRVAEEPKAPPSKPAGGHGA